MAKKKEETNNILKKHEEELEAAMSSLMVDVDDVEDEVLEGELVEDANNEEPLIEQEPIEEPIVNNNGHKPSNTIKEEKEDIEETEDDEETWEEDLDDKEIPGKGFMYAVKEKHLPETTRLSQRMIFAMTFGYAKDYILKHPERKESFFEIYSNRLMKHQVGLDGKGRDEWFTYKNVIAQERAESSWEQQNR